MLSEAIRCWLSEQKIFAASCEVHHGDHTVTMHVLPEDVGRVKSILSQRIPAAWSVMVFGDYVEKRLGE